MHSKNSSIIPTIRNSKQNIVKDEHNAYIYTYIQIVNVNY